MAIEFIEHTVTSATTGDPGIPPLAVSGDFILMVSNHAGWQGENEPAGEWTRLGGSGTLGGVSAGNVGMSAWWCWLEDIVDATNPAPGSYFGYCSLSAFRGVDPNTPLGVDIAHTIDLSSGTAVPVPSVDTDVDGAMVVAVVSVHDDPVDYVSLTNANLTDLTSHFHFNTTASLDGGQGVASGVLASAGTSGETTYTVDVAPYTHPLAFSLNPMSAGGGSPPVYAMWQPVISG